VSALRLAADGVKPVVLQRERYSRAAVQGMRHDLEHVFHARTMSGVQPPVDLDVVPRVSSAVVTRRLVRREAPEALMFAAWTANPAASLK
jgi:hypothetical protein